MNGWYKMHRKKIHSPDFIAKYAFDWMLFEWLIASVNWDDEPRKRTFGGREWMEQTGEIVASVRYIATALKATKSQTECGLKRLQNADRIQTRIVDGKSLIAVTNFKHYQGDGQNTGQNTDRTRTEHRTNIKKEEVRTKKQASKAKALDARKNAFDEFWNLCHFKRAKGAAQKAYVAAVKRLEAEGVSEPHLFLRERMGAFSGTPAAHPTDHTPVYPSTWLNQERYHDDETTWGHVATARKKPLPQGNYERLLKITQAIEEGKNAKRANGSPTGDADLHVLESGDEQRSAGRVVDGVVELRRLR